MFDEKNRQQRNSVLSFLIAFLILPLLVLSVWLTEQVVHKYKAASADAEVDVEDVSETNDLKIAARKPRNRTASAIPKNDMAPESPVREENKKPEQEKAQTSIPESPSEPPPNPANEQGNVETQETEETEESLISDPLQQSANTVGKEEAGENLPKLIIRLTRQTIQSLIKSGKARLLVVIDDGNGPRQ